MEEKKYGNYPEQRALTETFFKRLEQWYYWMLAFPLIFIALGFLGIESSSPPKWQIGPDITMLLNYLLPLILVIDLLFVFYLYKKGMAKVDPEADTRKKLKHFQNFSLIVYVAVFFYSLALSVLYYLTHLEIAVPLYMGILLFVTFRRPSVAKAANDLKMSKEEYRSINYKEIPLKNQ